MLEAILGALGFVAVSAVGNRVQKAAEGVAKDTKDLAKLIRDTADGGRMLAERLRENGANLCAITGGHGHTAKIGAVGDDNVEHMRCLDCGEEWERPYARDWTW